MKFSFVLLVMVFIFGIANIASAGIGLDLGEVGIFIGEDREIGIGLDLIPYGNYGELWNKSDDGFETLDLVTTDVYVPVTKLNVGDLNGFSSIGGGNLTAQVGGKYKACLAMSGESMGNSEYGAKLFINSVGQDDCYSHIHFKVSDANSFSVCCIITLNINDDVQIMIDDHVGAPNDLLVKSFNLNLLRIGN